MVNVDLQARADGAVLHDLSERIHGLHLRAMSPTHHEWDALQQELTVLHEGFDLLHTRDLSGDLDRRAHDAWRARVRRLTTRLDHFSGTVATDY
jgi:hypothetical protein